MFNISTVAHVTLGTPERDLGAYTDSSTPGAGDGSPITKEQGNDIYYGLRAILNRVGMTPDGAEEGIITSQIRDALIKNIRSLQTLDANTTFTQFFNDADVYFTSTANRTADITAGSNRAGNELNIFNNASGDYTVIITYAAGKTITLTRSQSICLKWNGSKWIIKKRSIIGKSAQVDYGTFTSTPFVFENMILRAGQVLNRVDYPALWHYVNTYLAPVTDAAWLAGAVGDYSTGDLSTTFRMPDDRGLYFRNAGANSVMKCADTTAFFNGGNCRSVLNDVVQGHKHPEFINNPSGVITPLSVGGGSGDVVSGYYFNSNVQAAITTNQVLTGSAYSDGTNGTPRTGKETAPARVSRYSITYFED